MSNSRVMMCAEKIYIVASNKHWHRAGFEEIALKLPGEWRWVDNLEQLVDMLQSRSPRYIFFLHWSQLVPNSIYSRYECVCFHMTDVPYGRGGSPLQNLIKAGHKDTKLTALRMVKELDAGPVYAKLPMSLDGRAEDVYRRAGNLSYKIITWMIDKEPEPVPQIGAATNFKRRHPKESILPSDGTIQSIYDHIRMLDAPNYPLAYIVYGNFRLEFSNAKLDGDEVCANVVVRRLK